MKVYDPTMHDVKQAVHKLEWALAHLEDYGETIEVEHKHHQVIDDACFQIREAYRYLTEIV